MILTQSLLEEVKAFVLRNELTQVGTIADEPEAETKYALERVVPLVVGSLIELSEQVGGREVLWSMAREAAKTEILSNPHKALYSSKTLPDRGAQLISSLMGKQYEVNVQTIATNARVQTDSIVDLINIVVPVTLGILGEQVTEHGWSSEALTRWLRSQQSPQSGQFGIPTVMGAHDGSTNLGTAPGSTHPAEKTSRWLWIALVAAACLIGYLLGYKPGIEGANVATQPNPYENTPITTVNNKGPWDAVNPAAISANGNYSKANGSYIYDRAGVPVVLKLRGGVRQVIGANSTENKLYQFLINPVNVDTVNQAAGWIGFDRVYFEPNKAVLTAESLWQLSNIATILQTFPKSRVRVGGYTDTSGDSLSNQRLSEMRAKAAQKTLAGMGIPASRVDVRGYGSQYPIASNASPDGRSLNRRISIRVMQK